MTPKLLDDVKDMFDSSAHFTLPPIPLPVAFTQRGVALPTSLDAPAYSFGLVVLLQFSIDVSAVAVNYFLLAVQQIFHQLRVMHFGRGHNRGMCHSPSICSDMKFHAKKPVRSFSGTAHFGIEFFSGILLRTWRTNYRGIDNRQAPRPGPIQSRQSGASIQCHKVRLPSLGRRD